MAAVPRKMQASSAKNGGHRSNAGQPDHAAFKVDELDLALIARLRAEGRASNRSLADALGVNDATVAARLRRLEDEAIVRVVAVTDMAAFGHDLLAFGLVRVAGRPVHDVGAELAELEECIGVVVTTGRADLVLSVLARDRAHFAELIGTSISAVPGVESVSWELALDILEYESEWAVLDAADHPTEPWGTSEVVDDLDLRIIGLLQQDARSSNRRIAAELGVSEGTVRSRIRRMEDEQIIRIQAMSDVRASGLGASAYVGVTTEGGRVAEVARAIVEQVSPNCVVRSMGRFDLFLVVSEPSREALVDTVLHRIGALPGVRRTETIDHCGVLKHSYTWARII
jgi:DNA-binding Lrp family transcriptional regulator